MDPDATAPLAEDARAHSRAAAQAVLAGSGPRPLTPGTTLGPYTLGEVLGRGGSAMVFAAHDSRSDRPVALKVLRGDASEVFGDRARARMLGEAHTLARLRHPTIVRVFDVGIVGQYPVIAMELVKGRTLIEWLDGRARTPHEVIATLERVGVALDVAHRTGIVHRDVKPANIMVRDDGDVCLLDFGIARDHTGPAQTASSVVLGSRGYIAPERLTSALYTPATDQFALAATVWRSLMGEPPPPEPGPLPAHDRHGAPIPAGLHAVVARALATDPVDRFESMRAMVRAMARARAPWRRPLALTAAVALSLAGTAAALWLLS